VESTVSLYKWIGLGNNGICRLDKGTFDAIALAEPMEDGVYMSDLYPARVDRLVKAGGYFLITCEYFGIFTDALLMSFLSSM
jgi:hypothetical protein